MTVKPSIPNTESISLAFPELLEKALREKPEKAEFLIYKSLFYNILNNKGLEGKSDSSVYTCLLNNNSKEEAFELFLRAVLENTSKGLEVTGVALSFHVPFPNKKSQKKILEEAMAEISEAAELIGVPVISANVVFINPPHSFSFLTISVKTEEKADQAIEYRGESEKIFWCTLDNSVINSGKPSVKKFSFKIFKEAISELTNINGISCYYSANTLSELLAEFYIRTDYSGFITLLPFSKLTGISGINKLLTYSAKYGFIIKIPARRVQEISRIFSKWNLNCYELGEVIPDEPCVIDYGVGQKLNIHNDVIDKLIAEYKKLPSGEYEKSEHSFILPDKILSEKEISTRLITNPNIASKKWIIEQLEQFTGNNNLSINYHTDTPLVFSPDNSINNFLLSVNFQSDISVLKNVLVKAFLEVLRRFAATNAVITKAQITFLTNNKEITYSNILEIDKIVSSVNALLNLEIDINYSFIDQYTNNGLTLYPIIYCSGTVDKENLFLDYDFKEKGDMIFLIGNTKESFSADYIQEIYNRPELMTPAPNIKEEIETLKIIKELIDNKLVKTVHTVSKQGLYVSLVESCTPGCFGFDITTVEDFRNDVFLFGSEGGRFIISLSAENEDKFIDYMLDKKYAFTTLGHVTKEELRIDDISFGFITDIRKVYLRTLEELYRS